MILMNMYKNLQPLFLKNITAYPGDQTQSLNAASHSSVSRKTSLFTGSNVDNDDVNSGSETKGKTLHLYCKFLGCISKLLGNFKWRTTHNTLF